MPEGLGRVISFREERGMGEGSGGLRAVAFVDGQNLYHAARESFGYRYPNYDPLALARVVCEHRGWRLEEVRFYTGVPAAGDDPFWSRFRSAKLRGMGRGGAKVVTRPLRNASRGGSVMGEGSTARSRRRTRGRAGVRGRARRELRLRPSDTIGSPATAMGDPAATSKPRVPGDRTREILLFFIERLSGSIGRSRLAKLAYMADLESRRYLGHPLTRLRYRVDHFGPFDPRILRELDALRRRARIFEERLQTPDGSRYHRYRAAKRAHRRSLTRGEEAILSYVLSLYAEKDLREFLDDVILETAPFRRAKAKRRGTPLDMDSMNNEAKDRLGGIDLEKVLLAEEEARAGKTVPLEEARGEHLGRDRRKRAS
jgi:antitoxin SocA-like protein